MLNNMSPVAKDHLDSATLEKPPRDIKKARMRPHPRASMEDQELSKCGQVKPLGTKLCAT